MDTSVVTLPTPELRSIRIQVRGTAPLICHAWSRKAKQQMLDKQMKKASLGKTAKDPEQDFKDSLYELDGGGYGFPSVAFKQAAVRAGTYSDMKMTFLRGAFHVLEEFVPIDGAPTPREDMVRVGMGTADIRYRGEFKDWSAEIPVRYNARVVSLEEILNLFRIAGFSVGVGEWRPEKDGSFGTFDVVGVVQ